MTWTSKPPSERGWYWVNTNPRWDNAPEIVFVGYPEYDNRLHVYDIQGECVLVKEYHNKFTRLYLGPIPYPEK